MTHMSNTQAQSPEHKTVIFMGNQLRIALAHNWVSLAELRVPGGARKIVAVSYAVKPTTTENGHYIPQPGTDSTILCEVNAKDHRDTLKQVGGAAKEQHPAAINLVRNTKELLKSITAVLESDADAEDKAHALYCPEHGCIPQCLTACMPALEDLFGEEDEDMPTSEEIKALLMKKLEGLFGATSKVNYS